VSCRVTIIGSARRLDATLPADIAVAELLADLVDMLGESQDGEALRWGLVRVGGQALDPELSLADQRVDEGTMLFLRDLTLPAEPPSIDDFSERVALAVDAQRGRWTGATMPAVVASLAGASLAAAGAVELVAGDRSSRALVGTVGAAIAVGAGVALARVLRRMVLAEVVVLCSLPLWAAAGAGIAGLAGAGATVMLAAGLAGMVIGSIAAVAIAGNVALTASAAVISVAGLPALVIGGAAAFDAGLLTAVAVLVPLELAAIALLAPLTVRLSGLDAGPPASLAARLDRSRHLLAASLIGTVIVLTASCAVLSLSSSWFARILVAVAALAMAFRARHFRFAAEVVPLLAAAAVALILLEYPLAIWLGIGPRGVAGLAGLLLADAVVLVAAATWIPSWKVTPQIARWLGPLESFAIAASVPLALGAMGAFDAAARFARGL
jgi:type VII secretion integral membrane protein EccD